MKKPKRMPPLRVLISGGGIAGPALAFWLTRLGCCCTILERFPSLRTNGQQIDIREQGIDVAKRMGLLEEIRKLIIDEKGLQFVDAKGKQKAMFPRVQSNTGQQGFTTEFEMLRGDLCKLLADATKDKTEYRFGVSVVEFKNEADHVKVKLSDGRVETYDMLVGADGQGSRTRRMLLKGEDSENHCFRKLGLYIAFYSLPKIPEDTSLGTVYHAPGQRVMITRWRSGMHGQGYLATMAHADELEQVLKQDVSRQMELFGRIFQGAGWQADRLIEAMHKSEDFYAQSIVQLQSKVWSKGRVVLLGDAAYCPSPLTGMGTSLALVGAYVLAGEISKNQDNLEAAFAEYDKTLRPLVDRAHKLPPGVPGIVYPKSEWAIKILYCVLSLMSMLKTWIDMTFRYLILPMGEAWKLPDYPELDAEIPPTGPK
ncbi:Uncharacterized protein TPAR_05484 [Tolypocladium paradoxum]|uniref:FAD-binding domain-containing protein n=1 Tax=Tolypocladium paradoxum TaxID=94208 RepID=A0A2S4KVZ5_9HYPO|nr:Uncharacterized protein TPAR_05484 [Tolypocladium paradoxum]